MNLPTVEIVAVVVIGQAVMYLPAVNLIHLPVMDLIELGHYESARHESRKSGYYGSY